jgi:hypothetical protein
MINREYDSSLWWYTPMLASRAASLLQCSAGESRPKRAAKRFEDTMKAKRIIATAVTATVLSIFAAGMAIASENYVFPSASGIQLSATPAPTFAPPVQSDHPRANLSVPMGTHVYGQPMFSRREPPLPPPIFANLQRCAAPYVSRLMSHALMVAPYANYAADQARLFAPNYAVTAWTDRVFGIVDSGYGAVDGWTAATYGMPGLRGPRRRGESPPDLTTMPTFRAHPELDRAPSFKNQGY